MAKGWTGNWPERSVPATVRKVETHDRWEVAGTVDEGEDADGDRAGLAGAAGKGQTIVV